MSKINGVKIEIKRNDEWVELKSIHNVKHKKVLLEFIEDALSELKVSALQQKMELLFHLRRLIFHERHEIRCTLLSPS